MATLTTEWQTVSTTQKDFSSTNWIKYHIDAKVGSPNVAAGTIPIYTRLRTEVNYTGWAGNGYKWSLTYAQHTASAPTWEGSDTWYFGTETILETITPTDIKYNADGNKSVTLTAVCQNNYHTKVNATITVTVDLPKMTTYYFDINGRCAGVDKGNVSGFGTFYVNINGSRVASNVSDFSGYYIATTTYEIGGITPATGRTYSGIWSGKQSGTITGNTTTVLKFDNAVYTNTIGHYAAGFVNGEGNAGGRKQFIFLGDTSFTGAYTSTITYDSSKFTTIPNGYQWYSMGGSSFDSSWVGYPLGQQFSQPAKNTSMQFDYMPIDYTITYSLDGGTNNSANPTSYNVLYGVTFANPTKKGYTFTGWKMDGAIVTGINPGATANFADSTALYNGLKTRTTGNKTVTATWKANTYKVEYILDGGTNHPDNPTECVYEREYVLRPPTKPGYKFKGWIIYDCDVWNGNKLYVHDKDAKLEAVWEKLQASTKIKVNGAWVTGNVYIKKESRWVVAQNIYVKKEGTWVSGT